MSHSLQSYLSGSICLQRLGCWKQAAVLIPLCWASSASAQQISFPELRVVKKPGEQTGSALVTDFRETLSKAPNFLSDSYTKEYFDSEDFNLQKVRFTSDAKYRQQRFTTGFAFTF